MSTKTDTAVDVENFSSSVQGEDSIQSTKSSSPRQQDIAYTDENPSSSLQADSDNDGDDDDNYQHAQCCEGRVANVIIKATQAMLCTPLAIIWIILVIISGAIFFFFMVEAIPLDSESKEEKWLNYSIQVLNVLFTYAAVANEPKRARQFIRLLRVRGSVGIDYQGKTSNEIFDYVPYGHRMFIVVNLNLNCIFQYINQTFRIIYFTPELAAQHVWETNVFFALSFLCAIVAPIHQYRMEQRVRKQGRAPPGQELDPIQRFMGRADYSYRDLGIESYEYAVELLKRRMSLEQRKDSKDKDDSNNKDDSKTDRTAVADSQFSLQCSQVELGTSEQQDNGRFGDDDELERGSHP